MERITVREAARRLGVTPVTVRRKIAAGQLPAELEARPQGSRWWVCWDVDAHGPPQGTTGTAGTEPERAALSVALETIADLRRRLDTAERRLDAAEQAQAELRRLLAGAMQALPSPASAPEPPAPATPAEMPRAAPERPLTRRKRRSWWERLVGR